MLNDSPTVAVDASSSASPPLLTPAAAVGMIGEALQEAGRWSERDLVARIPSSLLIAALYTLAYILLSFVLNGGCTEDAAAPPHAAAAAVAATAAGGPPATDAELKKKGLRRIHVVVYEAKPGASATDDCVICLGEFDDGDKVCVLPRCHHVRLPRAVHRSVAGHASVLPDVPGLAPDPVGLSRRRRGRRRRGNNGGGRGRDIVVPRGKARLVYVLQFLVLYFPRGCSVQNTSLCF
jgi:hypothetical protein